jgi:hypothetical protein
MDAATANAAATNAIVAAIRVTSCYWRECVGIAIDRSNSI